MTASPPASVAPAHVLIIEDEPDIAAIIKRIVEDAGRILPLAP